MLGVPEQKSESCHNLSFSQLKKSDSVVYLLLPKKVKKVYGFRGRFPVYRIPMIRPSTPSTLPLYKPHFDILKGRTEGTN